jgi:hypothetical protein
MIAISPGDRGFESAFLQRCVTSEPQTKTAEKTA